MKAAGGLSGPRRPVGQGKDVPPGLAEQRVCGVALAQADDQSPSVADHPPRKRDAPERTDFSRLLTHSLPKANCFIAEFRLKANAVMAH